MLFDEDAGQDPAFLIGLLKDLGYDGVKFYEPKVAGEGASGDTFVAFNPEQIKSAIGNIGQFDPANLDIRKSLPRPQFYSQLQRVIDEVPERISTMPVRWAKDVPGQNGEQSQVRQKDLDAIRQIIRDTGKMPLNDNGTEYVPYIEIGYDGKPWVSEGNHRIMAAAAEGLEYIPAEVRYFDGGQRRAGKWAPENLLDITKRQAEAKFSRSRQAEILSPLGDLSNDPDYAAGKSGDLEAALRTAKRIIGDRDVTAGIDSPIVVGVASIEQSSRNYVPFAAAYTVGGELDTEIVQSSSPKRTAMDGLGCVFSRPIFSGPVQANRNYVLVDDTITQGGTFAALADHIEPGGGRVAKVVALSGKRYSATVSAEDATISLVREKFGDHEDDFRKATGYGFDQPTHSKARSIANLKPASAVRDRIAQEAKQAGPGDPQETDGQARLSRDRATDTPEFKAQFGDSKVVDENGQPLVIYTGPSKAVQNGAHICGNNCRDGPTDKVPDWC